MADYWYAQHGGAQAGPVSLADLRQLIAAGTLKPGDYVWSEGWNAWRHPRDVAELKLPATGPLPAEPVEAEVVGASPATARPAPAAVPVHGLSSNSSAPLAYGQLAIGPVLATESAVSSLLQCRPWMMLFAIVGFVVSAATGIAGAVLVLGGILSGGDNSVLLLLLGLIFAGVTVIYALPAVYLARGCKALGAVRASRNPADLERAAVMQSRFWRFLGLSFIATVISYVLIIIVAISAG